MMLLYWYTNTFLFCLCLWLPWRLCPCLLVLYIHRCQRGLGLFQPPCPQALTAKVTGKLRVRSSCPGKEKRGSVIHPQGRRCPA